LVDTPYVYNGIWTSCDVNEDGLTDYLLNVKGTDPSNWEPYQFNEDSLVDRNKRGFILVINRGDYFETDIRNYDCFPSENEDGGSSFPPELIIETNNKSLTINYEREVFGSWAYEFIYKKDNYVLTSYSRSMYRWGFFVKSQHFDFVNHKLKVYKLQRNSNMEDRKEESDDQYMTIYYSYYKIKPIMITDIVNID
jgi:hypothetical protein